MRSNVQLVDGIYRGLVRVGRGFGALASRFGNLVIQKVGCRVLAMIRMKSWAVNRVETIFIWIER